MREMNISMDFRKSGRESVKWVRRREASGELLALEGLLRKKENKRAINIKVIA
jgi:hypothetical protein